MSDEDNKAPEVDPTVTADSDVVENDSEQGEAGETEGEEIVPDTEWDGERAPYEEHDGRQMVLPGNDRRDFVGVTDEYKNYANEYDRPILTDAERLAHTSQYDHLVDNVNDDGSPNLDHPSNAHLREDDEGDGDVPSEADGTGDREVIGYSPESQQRTTQPATPPTTNDATDLTPLL